MSDNYDPLSTQTAAFTFRRLDALQDSVAAFGKTSSGAPVAILVAADGTLQTRRLSRSTDEVVLIATDSQAVARPVLVDSQGRFSFRPLSASPSTDFDGVRAYLLGPAASQVQGKADADGTLNVNDPTTRASLASIFGQLDAPTTALRDAITGTSPSSKTLYALDADLVAALQATQPRSVSNFPGDYPDAASQARLLSILGQLDRPLTEVFDLKTGYAGVTNANNTSGLTATLDLGPTGRPKVHRFISTGGAATILTQVSRDGIIWRTMESQSFTLATINYSVVDIGFRYLRVTSSTTNVTLEFELSACR